VTPLIFRPTKEKPKETKNKQVNGFRGRACGEGRAAKEHRELWRVMKMSHASIVMETV
jgi:hypothetical protein